MTTAPPLHPAEVPKPNEAHYHFLSRQMHPTALSVVLDDPSGPPAAAPAEGRKRLSNEIQLPHPRENSLFISHNARKRIYTDAISKEMRHRELVRKVREDAEARSRAMAAQPISRPEQQPHHNDPATTTTGAAPTTIVDSRRASSTPPDDFQPLGTDDPALQPTEPDEPDDESLTTQVKLKKARDRLTKVELLEPDTASAVLDDPWQPLLRHEADLYSSTDRAASSSPAPEEGNLSNFRHVVRPDIDVLLRRSLFDDVVSLSSRAVRVHDRLQMCSPHVHFVAMRKYDDPRALQTGKLTNHPQQTSLFIGQTPTELNDQHIVLLYQLAQNCISTEIEFNCLRRVDLIAKGGKDDKKIQYHHNTPQKKGKHFHVLAVQNRFAQPILDFFYLSVLLEPNGAWVPMTSRGLEIVQQHAEHYRLLKDKVTPTPNHAVVFEPVKAHQQKSASATESRAAAEPQEEEDETAEIERMLEGVVGDTSLDSSTQDQVQRFDRRFEEALRHGVKPGVKMPPSGFNPNLAAPPSGFNPNPNAPPFNPHAPAPPTSGMYGVYPMGPLPGQPFVPGQQMFQPGLGGLPPPGMSLGQAPFHPLGGLPPQPQSQSQPQQGHGSRRNGSNKQKS